ncbi:UPF0280 family protein [Desulfobacterales bacterium HSG16]|nr:UPF0280 family protein [Desulfobacterales bacterium HSG16]
MKAHKKNYRSQVKDSWFNVIVKETDLFIQAPPHLKKIAREAILKQREIIESYIIRCPEFAHTLDPIHIHGIEADIIHDMAAAGKKAGVGPMAAVAGAIAERVGRGILRHTDEVIVENGGDVFIKKNNNVDIAIFAGRSPLSMKVGIRIPSHLQAVSVCTSSGTVGHSLSLGSADAVCVVSDSCSLADALATSVGNMVNSAKDIQKAIDMGRQIKGVSGLVVIVNDRIGMWGDFKLVPIAKKKL